jgi:DNA-binding MarR family transcriptional regulator
MPVSKHDVRIVQACYPQIYLACHTRHTRRRSSTVHLSATDGSLLAHLDERAPVSPSVLAGHLGVAASTLSASIKRLTALGYIARTARAGDGRVVELRLTARGAAAMQASSVLEARRVRSMLANLDVDSRRRALDGLALLADAARIMSRTKGGAMKANQD